MEMEFRTFAPTTKEPSGLLKDMSTRGIASSKWSWRAGWPPVGFPS